MSNAHPARVTDGPANWAATQRTLMLLAGSLYERTQRDGLTGLLNRDGLLTTLERLDATTPLTAFFIDLDRFKPVNDRYGHRAGDHALRIIGDRLSAAVRRADAVARLGGDEFVVALSGASACAELDATTLRLDAALNDPLALETGETIHLGGSIGVAVRRPSESVSDLLNRADSAMYQVKRARGAVSLRGSGPAAHIGRAC